jgi:hypothetical protein
MHDQTNTSGYHRYHLEARPAPDVEKWPSRFTVEVKRIGLASLLVKEMIHYGPGKMDVTMSRPCMYGVFSGPVGGFAPRSEHCVGCLRCTTEFPDFVRVSHNPGRRALGDSFFTFNYVDQISYEAGTGQIPVKGAGYRGKFGGEGWDGMWTDMSEIVRPTRDGIHGREFISTVVNIGYKPNFLTFDANGKSVGATPQTFDIPLPILFDRPPASLGGSTLPKVLARAAAQIETMAVLPLGQVIANDLNSPYVVPLVKPGEQENLSLLRPAPRMIEMDGWDAGLYTFIIQHFPESLVALRMPFGSKDELLELVAKGIQVFHLLADFHGRGPDGRFVLDLIRATHGALVEAGIRQEVTLLGSGGMIAAEHIPKAILCGLDAVAIDTPPLVAMQARFNGECADRDTSPFSLPANFPRHENWAVQRLQNLAATWRDQLLEIMGAMGLREVRRLRGEMGRAMFMKELEAAAFAEVQGYGR